MFNAPDHNMKSHDSHSMMVSVSSWGGAPSHPALERWVFRYQPASLGYPHGHGTPQLGQGAARSFASSPSSWAAACAACDPSGATSEASELPAGARKATLPHKRPKNGGTQPRSARKTSENTREKLWGQWIGERK